MASTHPLTSLSTVITAQGSSPLGITQPFTNAAFSLAGRIPHNQGVKGSFDAPDFPQRECQAVLPGIGTEALEHQRGTDRARAGGINAAQILAELGNVRERFPTEDQLAAEAGVCPVTHASGRSRGVLFRWACNKNLRLAITCFADNSRHASAWAAAIYSNARQRGCKHPHAVRILARAWVRVLWRAWQDAKPYDPAAHAAAARIA
jgi:hypothetical protein